MKKKVILYFAMAAAAALSIGCTATTSVTTGNANANAKPANTTAANTANTDSKEKPKTDKPKDKLASAEKPQGSSKAAKKDNPVPSDWIYVYDSSKGYGFYVPDGSVGESDTTEGVDFMVIQTPAPSEIDIFVLAYKNKELTKEDLLDDAVAFLEGMGQKVTPGVLKAESDEYAVADAATELPDGKKGKIRILVGTDVTDNYVMILGTAEDRFSQNEKIIDEIWGSFEMWSMG